MHQLVVAALLKQLIWALGMLQLLAMVMALLTLTRAASDVTLKLNMDVFGLGGGDGSNTAGDGGGGIGSLFSLDAGGNIALISNGAAATQILSLTTLIPIPQSIQNGTNGSSFQVDSIPLLWDSPTQLAYHLSVTTMDTSAYIANGWLASNVMEQPILTVAPSGRVPPNETGFDIGLNCLTEGKVRMRFELKICESAAATWTNGGCSSGTTQTVAFNVDKECGGGNVLPGFCSPSSVTPLSASAKSADGATVFNLNVAEGAGIDRAKFAAKGAAVAAKVLGGGFDIFTGQEIWDEEDRAAIIQV